MNTQSKDVKREIWECSKCGRKYGFKQEAEKCNHRGGTIYFGYDENNLGRK